MILNSNMENELQTAPQEDFFADLFPEPQAEMETQEAPTYEPLDGSAMSQTMATQTGLQPVRGEMQPVEQEDEFFAELWDEQPSGVEQVAPEEEYTGLRGLPASIKSRWEEAGLSTEEMMQTLEADVDAGGSAEAAGLAGTLGVLGEAGKFAAGTVLDTAMRTVKSLIPEEKEKELGEQFNTAGNFLMDNPVGKAGLEALGAGLEKWDEFKSENPKAGTAIEGALGLAEVIPAVAGAKATKKGVGAVADLATPAKGVLKASPEKKLAKAAAATEKLTAQADELAGAIAQGDIASQKVARKVLSEIDPTDVKSYGDVLDQTKARKEAMGKARDMVLDSDTTPRKLDDLKIVKKTEAGEEVSANFVSDSIDQLEELYASDPDNLVIVKNLRNKAETQGLTRKELNDLAMKHGSEFKNKAFTKTGDPKTSVSAVKFENTRSGIKDQVRGLGNRAELEGIDKDFSDILQTEKLLKKVQESASALQQKVKNKSLASKIGGATGELINTITGGAPQAFMSKFLPSNMGDKTLNTLQIQKQLKKNLKKLQQAEEAIKSGEAGKLIKKQNKIKAAKTVGSVGAAGALGAAVTR